MSGLYQTIEEGRWCRIAKSALSSSGEDTVESESVLGRFCYINLF